MVFWRRKRREEEAAPPAEAAAPAAVEEAPPIPPAPAEVAAPLVSEIAVSIEESIRGRLSHEGEVLGLSGEGRLTLENRSTTPLLAVRVELTGVERTTIEEPVLSYRALAQGDRVMLAYQIKELPPPTIMVREDLLFPPDYKEPVLLLGVETGLGFRIALKNEGEGTLKDVRLIKRLPEGLTRPETVVTSGHAACVNGQVVWRLEELGPGQEATLTIKGSLKHGEARPLDMGGIRYSFTVEGTTLSGLDVSEVEAHGVMDYAISSEELDEINTWDVQVELVNRGDLRGRARLHLSPERGEVLELLNAVEGEVEGRRVLTIEAELGPGERRPVSAFRLKCEEDPRFEVVLFEPILEHVEYKSGTASMVIEATSLPVLAFSVEKSAQVLHEARFAHLGPSRLVSGVDNRVRCVLSLTNTGTAPIRFLEARELLPSGFEAPLGPKAVKVVLSSDGEELPLPAEHVSLSTEAGAFIITIRDLEAAVGKPMDSGDRLVVEYELLAVSPPRGEVFRLPSTVLASTREDNVRLRVDVPEERAPVLETVRARRSIVRFVSVEQVGPDLFRVSIRLENRGDMTLFNYGVIDELPPLFELVEAEPQPQVEGRRLTWTLEEFKPGQVMELTYTVRGTGDYDPKLLLSKKVS